MSLRNDLFLRNSSLAIPLDNFYNSVMGENNLKWDIDGLRKYDILFRDPTILIYRQKFFSRLYFIFTVTLHFVSQDELVSTIVE